MAEQPSLEEALGTAIAAARLVAAAGGSATIPIEAEDVRGEVVVSAPCADPLLGELTRLISFCERVRSRVGAGVGSREDAKMDEHEAQLRHLRSLVVDGIGGADREALEIFYCGGGDFEPEHVDAIRRLLGDEAAKEAAR